jgi:hypothetical protein
LKYIESLTTHLPQDEDTLLASDIDSEIYDRKIEVDIWELGHVCAQWRHVLWNTHGIFHTIAVRTPKTQVAYAISGIRSTKSSWFSMFSAKRVVFPN